MRYDNTYLPVLGHYYLPAKYHTRPGTIRIGSELAQLPELGQLIILSPGLIKMSNLAEPLCGVFKVTHINPEYFDHCYYESCLFVDKLTGMKVEPVFSVPYKEYKDYSFQITSVMDEDTGIVYWKHLVFKIDSGEVVSELIHKD